MIKLKTFEERLSYLKIDGQAFEREEGSIRYLKQKLYKTPQWKDTRHQIIIRDNGCDLGIEGRDVYDRIMIHHINPVSTEDYLTNNPRIYDHENLIMTCHNTHMGIHYGCEIDDYELIERKPGDTCPWKKI